MRLQSLLAVFGDNVNVNVLDTYTELTLGRYDGKESLAEILNHIQVEKVTIVDNELEVQVSFDPSRYYKNFRQLDLYNEYYEWYKDCIGVELKTVETTFGTIYLGVENYGRTLSEFIEQVINYDKEFALYVIARLNEFDEKRLNS